MKTPLDTALEILDEMYKKSDIDAIHKHHEQRGTKGKPNSRYHGIMRDRASRLQSLRDRAGPNPAQTTFKGGRQTMLKFAGEDSRKAKTLKPKED